jgi:hypothetical protein
MPPGEVLKADEKGMSSQMVELDDALFGADGNFAQAKPAARTFRRKPGKITPCVT